MNLKQQAEGAPYHLVTSMEECPLGRFWVVHLDADFEVYQSHEDPDLDEPNSWMRLKQFCEDNNCRPINMAFASKDLNPSTQINLDPLADAYFYTRRVRKLMSGNPDLSGYQDHAQGVGQLHRNTLKIIWEFDSGGIEFETRNIEDHPKSEPVSLIRK